MKSQSFVSLVCIIDQYSISELDRIKELQANLDRSFSDYEIILVAQKNVKTLLENTITKFLSSVPSVRYLQLSSNVSNDVIWSAGLENAIGDFIVLFDLLFDPFEIIEKSINECKAGTDVIVGTCNCRSTLSYRLLRPLAQLLLKLSDYNLPKNATSFRCLSRRAANAVTETGKFHHQFFMRIQKTEYPMKALLYKSLIPHQRSLNQGFHDLIRLMVFNSSAPLRLMSIIGFCGSFIGILFALYSLVIQLLRNDVVEGWTSTIFLISIFSMLQFIILAFISEYLARILDEQDQKSTYSVVFEKTSSAMINQDRINVWEESTTSDENLVATARNN